jgi:hypothetical protein
VSSPILRQLGVQPQLGQQVNMYLNFTVRLSGPPVAR